MGAAMGEAKKRGTYEERKASAKPRQPRLSKRELRQLGMRTAMQAVFEMMDRYGRSAAATKEPKP